MYELLAYFVHIVVMTSLAIQCASDKRPAIEKKRKETAKGKKSREGSKSSKSAKQTKSQTSRSLRSGKSTKSKSKALAADGTQSTPSSKSVKSSESSRRVADRIAMDKNQRDNNVGNEAVKADQLDLILEPSNLLWKPAGGIKKVELSNPGNERQAIKVKCTDNDLYRVNPVYTFIEPGQTVSFDVVRNNGGNKNDKIVFLATKAANNDSRPKELFKPGSGNAVVVLPLLSTTA